MYYSTELNISASADDVMQAYFSIDGNEYAGMPFTSDDDFTLYYVLKENGKVGIELVFYGDSGTPGTIGTLFFKVSKASY